MWVALTFCLIGGIWVGYVAGALVNPTVVPVDDSEPPVYVDQHWLLTYYPALMTGLMIGVGFVLDWSAGLVARAARLLFPGKCQWCDEGRADFTLQGSEAPRLCRPCAYDPGHDGVPVSLAVVA